MADFFLSDERIGVVTAKIVFDWGECTPAGDVVGPEGLHDRGTEITEPWAAAATTSASTGAREGDCAPCDAIAEVDGGIGCCMMYRRDVALEIGRLRPGLGPGLVRRPRPDAVLRRGG